MRYPKLNLARAAPSARANVGVLRSMSAGEIKLFRSTLRNVMQGRKTTWRGVVRQPISLTWPTLPAFPTAEDAERVWVQLRANIERSAMHLLGRVPHDKPIPATLRARTPLCVAALNALRTKVYLSAQRPRDGPMGRASIAAAVHLCSAIAPPSENSRDADNRAHKWMRPHSTTPPGQIQRSPEHR